jgi:hypothetical protein
MLSSMRLAANDPRKQVGAHASGTPSRADNSQASLSGDFQGVWPQIELAMTWRFPRWFGLKVHPLLLGFNA